MKKQGEKIIYDMEQKPTEGKPINASFSSSGSCLTQCIHEDKIKIGSMGCQSCTHFGGAERFAVATGGTGQYGSASETRNIYCKKD